MKHEDIKSQIDALGEKYRKSDSVSKREEISTEIRDLTTQLQDSLAKGANACPDGADHRVIGMLKRPGYYDGRLELDVPEQWEVGCIECPPVLVKREGGVKRWSHSARGATPKEAVANWNEGKWVEDGQIDRVPSQEIFKEG